MFTEGNDMIDARHEAAHAVVAIRLGLPLAFTTIRHGDVVQGFTEGKLRSVGYTSLAVAAGIVSEYGRGKARNLHAISGDQRDLLQAASILLGVNFESNNVPENVREWCAEQFKKAEAILYADDGAAWDRTRVALLRRKYLSGDEVRKLVGNTSARKW